MRLIKSTSAGIVRKIKGTSFLIGVVLYVPFWWRIIERQSSGDISLVFQGLLLTLQAMNLSIAWLDNARFFKVWYTIQCVFVAFSIGLVWYFYD